MPKARFGWTVIRRDEAPCGFHVYKRTSPADEAHFTADLAPFTHTTARQAHQAGTIISYRTHLPDM